MLVHKRVVRHNSKPVIRHGPMLSRDSERMANLNYIYNINDVEIVNMLRMTRSCFSKIVKMFRERGLLEDNIYTSMEDQVVMFLHVVGHNQRFRVNHNTFRKSNETIS